MNAELIVANGISGLTGEYLVPPLEPAAVAARAAQPPEDPAELAQLTQLHTSMTEASFGLPFDIDPANVAQAGWAVVFSTNERDDVKSSLDPLVEHRKQQIGDGRTKVLDYRPGERWAEWLIRHKTAPGNVVPEKVPYYVLLIGGPALIPFSFQYLLDTEYAVGRLDFDDADGYRSYVAGLIENETATAALRDRSATFFGTRHPLDRATQLSADSLVQPLIDGFRPGGRFASAVSGWQLDEALGDPATKDRLGEIFGGDGASGRPALLFSASHGVGGWPPGHADQRTHQGSLLCQDWPGIGQIQETHYFGASDVPADARVHGLIAFFFACFGAGTPEEDGFAHTPGGQPQLLAPEAFVSELPKRLLSHPEGGALAVVGHIDRAWGYSFVGGGESQLLPFQNALGRVLLGQPIGLALKDFNEKYAALSANLSTLLEDVGFGDKVISEETLARVWTERNDAQNYVLLGDPAASLHSD